MECAGTSGQLDASPVRSLAAPPSTRGPTVSRLWSTEFAQEFPIQLCPKKESNLMAVAFRGPSPLLENGPPRRTMSRLPAQNLPWTSTPTAMQIHDAINRSLVEIESVVESWSKTGGERSEERGGKEELGGE